MNKDEYVIINKTKLLQKIEELTEKMLIDDLIDMGATHSIIIYLERVLSNSIELIPEIEKAIEHGLNSFEDFDRNSNYDEESRIEGLQEIQEDYIKQLTLSI